MNEKTKLIRVGEPNFGLLAKYCKLIKGYGTASELAEKIGVNASTVSRILNGKLTSPVTEDTIIKLAELLPDNLGITKNHIYRANGMADPAEVNLSDRMESRRLTVEKMRSIITSSILNKDNSVGYVNRETRFALAGMTFSRPDFVIDTNAINDEELKENHNWAFRCIFGPMNSRDERLANRMIFDNIIRTIGTYITISFQRQEDYETDYEYHEFPLKLSIVFDDLVLYEMVKEKIKDLKTPVNISLLYVDITEHKVEKEFPLRRVDGSRYEIYFDGLNTYFDDDDNEITEEEWIENIESEYEEFFKKDKEDSR